MNTTYYIEVLKQKLEQSIAPQKVTIRSTEFLSGVIFGSIQENISATTLQRFFGIVSNKSIISDNSLDIICKFLGYANWNSFCSDKEVNSLKNNTKVVTDNMGLKLFEMALKNHNFDTVIDYIELLKKEKKDDSIKEVEEMLYFTFQKDSVAKEELMNALEKMRGANKLLPLLFN